mmetsp:Transcript_1652/g.2157  ORF Transcript_1652/g.2157 Transcript_1652/m.2157 type:complete len:117 (-) Transcript_1652:1190-1540(-)
MASLSKAVFVDLCGIFPEILTKMRHKSVEYQDVWKKFKILLLRRIDYFKVEPSKQAFDEIQFSMIEEYFEPGSFLFHAGDKCESIYFIVEGQVDIVIEGCDGEAVSEVLQVGDIIG